MKLIDNHIHFFGPENIDHVNAIADHIGADRMGVACLYSRETVNSNPAAYEAKRRHPDRFYVFAALDHSRWFSEGEISTPTLAEQIDRALAIGADGIKLLETKPDRRKLLDIPIDSDYFEGFFARAEEIGMPLLWHVADPPEFWDPELTPRWAAVQGWGYDETFTPYEQLLGEVENVLRRHPKLRVIFAHFLFLSGDLPRASALLDAYPGVHFDLAPGIELLYNLSKDPAAGRAFFQKYSDRLIYGTDIFGRLTLAEAAHRAGFILRWLETDDEFRVGEDADYLLGPPEDGVIRGMRLPPEVLAKIRYANFERLVGEAPRRLNEELARQECTRIEGIVGKLGPAKEDEEG